jgi:uncharacterized protein (TIGR02453 family)
METKFILSFLTELAENNNREWFVRNKPLYEQAHAAMVRLISELIRGMATFDSGVDKIAAKQCIFRIQRDLRFSKNKEPYKTNMGGFIVKGGRNSGNAGYYLHLEPGNSFLGGGIYLPDAVRLKAIRQEIYYSANEINAVLQAPDFKKYFDKIVGETLVRQPKGFDADFELIELIKLKSFTVLFPLDEKLLFDEHFIDEILPVFKAMKALNDFLNRALTE